jgi:hypothetical protein
MEGEGMGATEQQLQIHNGEQLSSSCLSESLCVPGNSTAAFASVGAQAAASLQGIKFSANNRMVRKIAVAFMSCKITPKTLPAKCYYIHDVAITTS